MLKNIQIFIFQFHEIGMIKITAMPVKDRKLPTDPTPPSIINLSSLSYIYRAQSTVDEEDDEAEWERFQRKLNKYV